MEAASAAQQAMLHQATGSGDAHPRTASPGGVLREDASTWGNDRWPRGVEGGILPYYGAGQSECAWYVRGRRAVRDVFAALWQTTKLLVSFDGLHRRRPGRQHRTEHGW